jgi:hypothetical protein
MTALGEMEALREEIINQSEMPLKPKMLTLIPFENDRHTGPAI